LLILQDFSLLGLLGLTIRWKAKNQERKLTMVNLGISVFIGMGQSMADNISYMERARQFGYSRLFTSLHIPEADSHAFHDMGRTIFTTARKLGFEVTADISPLIWKKLELQPETLKKFGIDILRADWGFSPQDLWNLTARSGLPIEVNASTMDELTLQELLAAGFDRSTLRAGHNYYPRPETGISFSLLLERSRFFQAKGMEIAVFLPGKTNRRGPISAGLPTVEAHRYMPLAESARQLCLSGVVNTIIFGDPLATDDELEILTNLSALSPTLLELRIRTTEDVATAMHSILGASLHTNRLDAAAQVIRSQESRGLCKETILPGKIRSRRRGDVTIDNVKYGRYMGELQIVLCDLPADSRVNCIGSLLPEDFYLLDCLTPGRTFRLKEVNQL
jgi:uncharacterized protein